MANVAIGQAAPDFTLPASNGKNVSLHDFRGKNVVLYFYPKDNTPGCTRESCDFRDKADEFTAKDTVILGVSTDDLTSHEKFIKKYNLPFLLLSDTEAEVSKLYGVYKLKKNFGKEYMGIERSTFIIDKEGRLVKEYRKVKVDGHVDEALAFISENLQ
ncbi:MULTISPECIES: thioredoxin-dependent thiol peroxidase [Aneurinibacillus]|uniref:thioredoxin-dependent peroxiredoxin n=1 Tax=Aneurinibacillus thermoaerophilus TaxID=143495 RepID=A0A1G8AAC5_ANETH|nr:MULTISPECIES: thioredoxin-dependent thiol peroxidase [Aneurinibacillus]AMA74059.1 peroxiredoxin [Aneurinibacillus sp. XH2]MED0675430.1 thioredoxin-dependent thiol peroxidase [Aneurinibacillus thermoaerophilus]MED0678783.1 thioredoxin-dependent thiol peroxidase [Aneurinibacillus thermoaerophilus]MED0736658.1 thioredoxin-dependent thiol peroxidase [Aneurinibacillus thermoaerophilus]MED0758313.1 thioredoxin-dependent thiol peroxidase [Aneurinibacillus thermoaerophilus]